MWKVDDVVSHMSAHQIPSLNQSLLSGFEPDGAVLAPLNDWSLIPYCVAARSSGAAGVAGATALSLVTVVVVVTRGAVGWAALADDAARTVDAGTNARRAARIMLIPATAAALSVRFTIFSCPLGVQFPDRLTIDPMVKSMIFRSWRIDMFRM
jgi:hypothetical protein